MKQIVMLHNYIYIAFRNSCLTVVGELQPSSSSFPVTAISHALSASPA